MTSDSPLKFSRHCNTLNPFLYGYLRITKEDIARLEWFNNSGGGGNSYSKLCYIHEVDTHYVVCDLNSIPIGVFHSFEEMADWANQTFNPDPPKKIAKCRLPAHDSPKAQEKLRRAFQKLFTA